MQPDVTTLPSAVAETTRAGTRLPSHLRGPFSAGKMQMSAKDWALLRDRDGNRIIKHRLGDVVAIVFGEDDEMEEQRAAMLAAAPELFATLCSVLDAFAATAPDTLTFRQADALAAARTVVAAADRGGRDG